MNMSSASGFLFLSGCLTGEMKDGVPFFFRHHEITVALQSPKMALSPFFGQAFVHFLDFWLACTSGYSENLIWIKFCSAFHRSIHQEHTDHHHREQYHHHPHHDHVFFCPKTIKVMTLWRKYLKINAIEFLQINVTVLLSI